MRRRTRADARRPNRTARRGSRAWRGARRRRRPARSSPRGTPDLDVLAAALMTLGSGSASASSSWAASRACMASAPSRSRSWRTVGPVAASMSRSESRQAQPSCLASRRPTVVLPAPISPMTTTCGGRSLHRRQRNAAYTSAGGTDRHRSTRRPSSASSAAASLGGCWRSRRARWATGLGARSRPRLPRRGGRRRVVVGSYDDVDAALRLAELQRRRDLRARARRGRGGRGGARRRRRSGPASGRCSSPRIGSPSGGSWRRRASRWRLGARFGPAEARSAAAELGLPIRLKVPIGGYDGRGQLRIVDAADLDDAWGRLGRPTGTPLLAERELEFEMELSVVVARALDGRGAAFPIARNVHDEGILVETVAPGAGHRRGRRRAPSRSARRWPRRWTCAAR